MATKMAKERKAKRRAIGARSGPENALRRQLAYQKKIKDENDDEGLLAWLRNLHAGNDHRSKWEKELEEQLEKELEG